MYNIKRFRGRDIPHSLLFLADEDDRQIERYRDKALFWAACEGEKIVGQAGLLPEGDGTAEIVTVSVDETCQNRRIATSLLEKIIDYAREKGFSRLLIKTGNCGLGQLALYQKCGFRFLSVNRDYFPSRYPVPIYENGIPCIDQIVLDYRIPGKEEIDDAIRTYWARFLKKYGEYEGRPYTSWQFGLGDRMANDLAGLVKTGRKGATASAAELYEEGEEMPAAGDLSIVTYGNGLPACIIETTEIRWKPFRDITADEAAREGEGDGSLEYWREAHRSFFTREYEGAGRTFSEEIPVIFELFRVIYDEDRNDTAEGDETHGGR